MENNIFCVGIRFKLCSIIFHLLLDMSSLFYDIFFRVISQRVFVRPFGKVETRTEKPENYKLRVLTSTSQSSEVDILSLLRITASLGDVWKNWAKAHAKELSEPSNKHELLYHYYVIRIFVFFKWFLI